MKKLSAGMILFSAVFLLGAVVDAVGQADAAATDAHAVLHADTDWPGIQMLVPEVKRIEGGRLVIAVSIFATRGAPAKTLIGIPPAIPAHPTKDQLGLGPDPFSLEGSVMTDEKTRQQFAMVAPNPNGPIYRPSFILATLSPGQAVYLTLQFPAPPPPAANPDGTLPRQTVSLLLPKAKGPITQIVIPPLAGANSHP